MPTEDIILEPARDEMQLVHIPATVLKTDNNGQRTVWRGNSIIAYEYGTTPSAWVRWLIVIKAFVPVKEAPISILHIEDGFCTLARFLGTGYQHRILLPESVMEQFVPVETPFSSGDWTVNIANTGTFDFILFNIGRQTTSADKDILVPHLKPEGLLLQP